MKTISIILLSFLLVSCQSSKLSYVPNTITGKYQSNTSCLVLGDISNDKGFMNLGYIQYSKSLLNGCNIKYNKLNITKYNVREAEKMTSFETKDGIINIIDNRTVTFNGKTYTR